MSFQKLIVYQKYWLPVVILLTIVVSLGLQFLHFAQYSDALLLIVLGLGSLPYVWEIYQSVVHRQFGVDILALTSIFSSIVAHEYLAGGVILLMLSGGELLEERASRQARRDLTQLLKDVPTQAHIKKGKNLVEVPVGQVQIDDIVLVKVGEVIPTDGIVIAGKSSVDESKLTGEAVPVEKNTNDQVMSGSVNVQSPLEIRVTRRSKESKYEQIIQLVREAEAQKAPFVRLADRYSVFFTFLAFSLAGIAWIISGQLGRALAVLVVATPCPLILATPVAFAAGISSAAKRGIIFKRGGAIEQLSETRSVLFDKTGTLTIGVPEVDEVEVLDHSLNEEQAIRIAASLDQASLHVLARALTGYARQKKYSLLFPKKVSEVIGNGVMGEVDGKKYVFGKKTFLVEGGVAVDEAGKSEAKTQKQKTQNDIAVYLADEKKVLAVFHFRDHIRPETKKYFAQVQEDVSKVVMVTGDKKIAAEQVAAELGIKEVISEALPEDKLRVVKDLQKNYGSVVMVGDGVNDAPALAAADVGVTLGSYATAASEASDVVITVSDLGRLHEALHISRNTLYIARQCIFVGIGLSTGLMLLAVFGFVKPVVGAGLQELIDVVVILNALRAGQQRQ